MNHRRSLIVLWGLLAFPLSSWAQTDARDVLDKAILALGGDRYLEATDFRSVGRFFQFQRNELVGGERFVDYVKFPDKERTEFGDKGRVVRINNGDRGWNVTEDGVEDQIPEQVALFREQLKVSLDYLLRVVVQSPSATLQYLGRDMVDFERVDVLELRDEDRTRITIHVSRENGLITRKIYRRLNDPAVYEEVFSNYHEIQGINTPLLIHRYTDGRKTMEIRLTEVTYNNALQETLFSEPSKR